MDHQRFADAPAAEILVRPHRLKEQRAIDLVDPQVSEGGETAIWRADHPFGFQVRRIKDGGIALRVPFIGEAVIMYLSQALGIGGSGLVKAETGWQRRIGQLAQVMPGHADAELVAAEAMRLSELGGPRGVLAHLHDHIGEAHAELLCQAQGLALAEAEDAAVLLAEAQIWRHLQIEGFPMRIQDGEGSQLARCVQPAAKHARLVIVAAAVEEAVADVALVQVIAVPVRPYPLHQGGLGAQQIGWL